MCSCLLSLAVRTRTLELDQLFEFGEDAGDLQLPPDSDSSAELPLNGSLFFFGKTFDRVHVSFRDWVGGAEVEGSGSGGLVESSAERSSTWRFRRVHHHLLENP